MSTNVIDAYSEFNENSIFYYNKLLLNYLYIENDLLNNINDDMVRKLIHNYLNTKPVSNSRPNVINIDLEIFLTSQNIENKDMNYIMELITQHVISLKDLNRDPQLVSLSRLLSNSIMIAIELNNRTGSLADSESSFKKVLLDIQKKYASSFEPKVLKLLKQPMTQLKDEYNRRMKVKKKLIEHYENNSIDFEGSEFENLKTDSRWFEVYPTYYFEKLKLTGKRKISTIVCEQKNFRDVILIIIDKIGYEILKAIYNQDTIPNYVVPLTKDFLKTKTNIEKVMKLLKNKTAKQHIYLEVDYKQMEKYMEQYERLLKNGISVIVTDIPKKYDKSSINLIKFIKIDGDLINDVKLLKILELNNSLIIIDKKKPDVEITKQVTLVQNRDVIKMVSKRKMI